MPLGVVGRTVLGTYMILVSILLAYLIYELWPAARPDAMGENPETTVTLFGNLLELTVSADVGLILVVMVVGALGGNVHALRSFADYAGARRLIRSWVWWYLFRPFVGLPLALIFYFGVRGGLLSAGVEAADINVFGIAAVSGLVGMFSDQAAQFLRRAFQNMFNPGPDERTDRLGNPVAEIVNIEPRTVPAGSSEVSLTVTGGNFLPESLVRFNGDDRPTTFVTVTQLTVRIPASDLASPGEAQVTVFNPPPGGGSSDAAVLRIQ